jgi:hypothetical protein
MTGTVLEGVDRLNSARIYASATVCLRHLRKRQSALIESAFKGFSWGRLHET